MKKAATPYEPPTDTSGGASLALVDAQLISERSRSRRVTKRHGHAVRARLHFSAVSEILEQAKRGS